VFTMTALCRVPRKTPVEPHHQGVQWGGVRGQVSHTENEAGTAGRGSARIDTLAERSATFGPKRKNRGTCSSRSFPKLLNHEPLWVVGAETTGMSLVRRL
jgi:hypothetical protein